LSWDLGFRFDWPALDAAKLEAGIRRVIAQYDDVLASRTPENEGTPDPDAYVRPGFEAVANEDGADERVWHFGLMHDGRRVWSSVLFTHEEDGCHARADNVTVDARTSEAFFELFEQLRDVLGGEDE